MSSGNAPFGGNVSPMFNAWTSLVRSVGSQFGLVNINVGKTADEPLENKIVTEVASYGSQLGNISDALDVLIKHLENPQAKMLAEDTAALYNFQKQHAEIEKAKKEGASARTFWIFSNIGKSS
jgi:hypothetical protein